MDNMEMSVLNDKFNMYYSAAQKAEEIGKNDIAKKNYMLAADVLLKMAKISSPELKRARMERVKRLLEIANSLECTPTPVKNQGKPVGVPKGASSSSSDEESDGTKWLAAEIPNIHFSDIAGLEDVKKAIITRMINPIRYADMYKQYNKKTGGGVLLYGPPGTGKTMIAKAIACEVGAKFFTVKGSDIVSKWVGDSEKNISMLFEAARKEPLSIIFIDEVDSLIGRRGVDSHNDKRVNEFLQQIDGFAGRNSNLLLLGATNRPWEIDSAAMRSGRFSQKIYVPLPDEPARRFLIQRGIRDVKLEADVDVDRLVELTEGFSGADIDEVCDRAKENPLLLAIAKGEVVAVAMKDFLDVIRDVRPSVSAKEIAMYEKYAGYTPTAEKATQPTESREEKTVEMKPQETAEPIQEEKINSAVSPEKNVLIEFAAKEISLLPNQKNHLEFFIDGNYQNASIKINGKNYICRKHIRNFISQDFEIEPGCYQVEIYGDGQKIGVHEITFIRGFQEEDFGF